MKHFRIYLAVMALLFGHFAFSQVTEDFTDGDYLVDPVWIPTDPNGWIVSSFQLRSGSTDVSPSFIATASQLSSDATWQTYFRLALNPTSGNNSQFWIISDSIDFTKARNGYYVQIGNSNDDISLWKKINGISSILIDGPDGVIAGSTNSGVVRVTRSATGDFSLSTKVNGSSTFAEMGTATNTEVNQSSFCGFASIFSASNKGKHYFDSVRVFSNTVVVDLTPPNLISASSSSANQVDLTFSEALDPDFGNLASLYSLNPSVSVSSAQRLANNFSVIRLTLVADLTPGSNSVSVSQSKDVAGNIQSTVQQVNFTYNPVVTPTIRSVVINEIMAAPSSSAGTTGPQAEYIELYNPGPLAISLNGWTIQDATASLKTIPDFSLPSHGYVVLASSANQALFVGLTPVLVVALPSLNNDKDSLVLKDSQGAVIDVVAYQDSWYQDDVKKAGGYSLEQINPSYTCTATNNWIGANGPAGGSPTTQNTMFSNAIDATPPSLISASALSANQIELVFSEGVDEAFLAQTILYSLNPILTIMGALPSITDLTKVRVTLASDMTSGGNYTITVSQSKDRACNVQTNSQQTSFTYTPQAPVTYRSVVINEIMAAPKTGSTNTAPQAEYIELYNPGNQAISLNGWTISDATGSQKTIPDFSLPSNGYVVLASATNLSLFSGLSPVLTLTMPSLNNDKDSLVLTDNLGNAIDIVSYKDSWYQDDLKKAGGFSLEQINPTILCSSSSNWTGANAPSGGSPTAINTVFSGTSDTSPPNLVGASAGSANQIDLNFSESVDPTFGNQISFYSLNPSISISSVQRLESSFSTIRLTLNGDMADGTNYTVSVSQSKDLACNVQTTMQQASFTYFPSVAAGFRTIVINEIMAAPDTSAHTSAPQGEYIELYNPGNQPVTLNGWTISDLLGPAKTIPTLILPPQGYIVLTSSSAANQVLFAGLSPVKFMTIPSLNDTGDSLVLSDSQGNAIDIVSYRNTWYQDIVKKSGGYSLEQINPNLTCSGSANWIGANAPAGGSPTMQNTAFSNASDQNPPKLVRATLNGLNSVILTFSEFLRDTSFANNLFSVPGFTITNVQPRNPSPEKLTLTLNANLEPGVKYVLSISGVKDCAGNLLHDTTVNIGKGKIPGRFELLITEVQSDDSPENGLPEAEYVELFNNTDKFLDLTGIQLTDGSNTAILNGALDKGEYLVVCYNPNTSLFSGVNVVGVLPYAMINTDGDNLTLKGANGGWLHQFHFRSSDYSPYSQWLKGWSLEMIDPTNPCDELGNWAISTLAVGGTPGKENSVKASKSDGNAPTFVVATLIDTNRVKLKWNELVDSSFLANTVISLSGAYQLASRQITSDDFSSLILTFTPKLLPGQLIDISVGPVADCAGNQSGTITQQAAQPEKADSTDWVLNEILFDPQTGGADYVELYNKSTKYLDLKELFIANDEEAAAIVFEPTVVSPGGFALLTPSKALTMRDFPRGKSENFVEVASFPSFNSDSGTVRLAAYGKTWQKFFYSDKDHAQILDETKGVSLERIASTLPVNEPNSWQSASADAGYGTPGYVNSQNRDVNPGTSFSADPKAFSPHGDGVNYKNFTLFTYSEAKQGLIANLRIYSADGFLVKNLAQSANLGSGGFWKWDGSTDDGKKARIGLYLAVLETYELGGDTKYHRIPVAVAAEK